MYEYTNEIFQLKTDFVLYPRGNLKSKWVLRLLEKSPGFLLRGQSLVGVLGVCASSDVSSYYAHGKDWEAPWQPPGPALCCWETEGLGARSGRLHCQNVFLSQDCDVGLTEQWVFELDLPLEWGWSV